MDVTPLEQGLLVAWCWEAVGMEGDKTLGSPECPLGNSKTRIFCASYSLSRELVLLRTELAATLPRHSSFSESWEQPLLEGWHGGHPGWDHLLSCFCLARGWQVPASPPFAVGRNRILSSRLGAQLSLHQGKDSPCLGRSALLELCR